MAEKAESALNPTAKAKWLKALSAVELKNYGYAVVLLQEVLETEPEFLTARRVLRKTVSASVKGAKGLFGSFGGMKPSLGKKDPKAALVEAEKLLATKPHDAGANMLLHDAASALGWPEVAGFALETIVEGNPKDTKAMHALAQFYIRNEEPDKAVDVFTRIMGVNPADMEAARAKEASARHSIKKGNWEREGDFKDKLKSKEETLAASNSERKVLSREQIDQQLEELYNEMEREPNNINTARRMALLSEQKEDFAGALQWYEYALGLTGGSDPGLARKITDVQLTLTDQELRRKQATLDAGGLDADSEAALRQEVADLIRRKALMTLENALKRVEANPTDLQLRLELGEQLFLAEDYSRAIPELQRARQNPNAKIRAMNLLAKCFERKGQVDLAERQFREAADSLTEMDSVKKDILYSLALLYDKTGRRVESMDCLRKIYEADYTYRDVASRVEAAV